mgnify:CR=1 FL=1
MVNRIGVLGLGAVGARVARQILATHQTSEVVLFDEDRSQLQGVARALGPKASVVSRGVIVDQGSEVLGVATPCGRHLAPVRRALAAGIPAISTSDRLEDVEALVGLDGVAKRAGTSLVAGACFAPGMTCVLAAYLGRRFDVVDEVHVAKQGTGGPACARQHHRALSSAARDWRDGGWIRRAGGSGRELVWFPEPVGGCDCYRAALPDAWLLRPAFPDAKRLTARMAATRQDRFTSWLPMLSPPHAEGGVGAIRVEIRGRQAEQRVTQVVGAVERPAVATAAVVAATAEALVDGWGPPPGARGLAVGIDSTRFLRALADRGLHAEEFAGLDDTLLS